MRPIDKDINFPKLEEKILEKWNRDDTFKRSLKMREGGPEYVFLDGPPFANNLPHYGHLLAGIIKDIVPRYWTMRGYHVERRFGWDTHGLPVEMEIEKELGIQAKGVEDYGIDRFNEACRASVLKYVNEWKRIVLRTGRWVDFDNQYLTMQPSFMETVWWVFKRLWEMGLIYEGHRILPYSTGCRTPLSNFEASSDYRQVQDPAITVRVRTEDDPNTYLLIWTTTPWTLPSNLAIAAHPEITYVRVLDLEDGQSRYIMAKSLVHTLFKEGTYEIEEEFPGTKLINLSYEPMFDFFAHLKRDGAFRVVVDDYVTEDDGTGLVHIAPAYGEDDFRVGQEHGLPLVDPVNGDGYFTHEVPPWKGMYIKDADREIIADLKRRGLLVKHSTIVHSYPFCERSGTPLIYKAMPVWFVKVTAIKDRLLKNNELTTWVPAHIKHGRFGKWLEGARDWNISRNRYWGTPIPIYKCQNEDCDYMHVVGSIAELEELTGEKVDDLHMHKIDHLSWKCPKCGGTVKRITEVLDCWFESGAMPYAQNHYPFENKERVEAALPADFIAEGLDQTRGWFYTLMVLSTALFDKPAFRNVIVNGLILAEDGKKMSKRLRNYPDPTYILEQYGADALRLYLINSGLVKAEELKFSEKGVRDVVRLVLLPLWNAYNFFVTYALIDGWEPDRLDEDLPSDHILDQWILSRVETLNKRVREEMDAYRLYKVVPALVDFVDELTNWYIRLNRRRFWRSGLDGDKRAAYATLYSVLRHFSLLLAPFTPFLAEEIYGNLTGSDETDDSVHLQDFPEPRMERVDEVLEHTFALMQEAILLGRSLREEKKVGVRQPLPKLTIIHSDEQEFEHLKPLLHIIREELNVKDIEFATREADFVDIEVKPNLKILGPKYGKKVKQLRAAIMELPAGVRWSIVRGEQVEVAGETLSPEEFLVIRKPKEGLMVRSGDKISVAMDFTITHELKLEGLAREMINRIQRLRKDSGFEVQDRITIFYSTDDDMLGEAIEKFGDKIAAETLALSITSGINEGLSAVHYDIHGRAIDLAVKKTEA